jgi:hypothetical protein
LKDNQKKNFNANFSKAQGKAYAKSVSVEEVYSGERSVSPLQKDWALQERLSRLLENDHGKER